MKNTNNYILEAEKIGYYLLSIPIQNSEKNTYSEAMQQLEIPLSNYEKLLWKTMLKSKWRMACIDAGLALKEPANNVRRKIFTMLAILEASPNYSTYFFSRKFSFFYLFKIGLVGIRSVIRALVGLIFIKNIENKCN